jgi:hypothetical protein
VHTTFPSACWHAEAFLAVGQQEAMHLDYLYAGFKHSASLLPVQVFVTLVVSVQYQVRRDHTFDAVSALVIMQHFQLQALKAC